MMIPRLSPPRFHMLRKMGCLVTLHGMLGLTTTGPSRCKVGLGLSPYFVFYNSVSLCIFQLSLSEINLEPDKLSMVLRRLELEFSNLRSLLVELHLRGLGLNPYIISTIHAFSRLIKKFSKKKKF